MQTVNDLVMSKTRHEKEKVEAKKSSEKMVCMAHVCNKFTYYVVISIISCHTASGCPAIRFGEAKERW